MLFLNQRKTIWTSMWPRFEIFGMTVAWRVVELIGAAHVHFCPVEKRSGVYFYIQSWTCSNTSSWSYHTANFSFSLPPTPPLSLCQGTRYLTFKPQLLCRQIVIAKARRFKLSGKWTCAKGLRVKPHKHKEFILDIEMFRNEASGIHRRCCLFLTLSVHPSAPPGLLLPKPTHPLL